MRISLVKFANSENSAANGLDDVILPMWFALRRLGYAADVRFNKLDFHGLNILFNSHSLPPDCAGLLPANCVIVNLEQLVDSSWFFTDAYLSLLRSFPVWDYSRRNAENLESRHGIRAEVLRLGYVPEMTRVARQARPDMDVLYYGLLNDRRNVLLQSLPLVHLKVGIHAGGLYGAARDLAIGRAKILVNVHYYVPAILEVPRLGYLWANRLPVISERAPDTEVDADLEGACAYSSLEELPELALRYARSPLLCRKLADAAFEIFRARPLTKSLKELLGRRIHTLPPLERAPYRPGPPGEWRIRNTE